MAGPSPSNCRSCGAPIYWAHTENGKPIPVDVAPAHDGNVLLTLNRATGQLKAEVYGAKNRHNIPPGRNRYKSHFATCPDRDDWRS